MTFYLDPDKRKFSMEDLGLSWDYLLNVTDEKSSIEGTFYAKNGRIVDWFELPDHCPDCLERLSYNEEFDSVFCAPCNEWRDIACNDPTCTYCKERPDKPSACD